MSNPLIKHKTLKYQDGKPIKKYYPPFTKEQKAWMDKMGKMSGRADVTDSPIDWFLGFSLAKPFLSLGKRMALSADDAIKFVSLYPKAMGYGIAATPIIKKGIDLIAPPESNPKIEETKQQKAWNDAMNYKTNTFVKYQRGGYLPSSKVKVSRERIYNAIKPSVYPEDTKEFLKLLKLVGTDFDRFKDNKALYAALSEEYMLVDKWPEDTPGKTEKLFELGDKLDFFDNTYGADDPYSEAGWKKFLELNTSQDTVFTKSKYKPSVSKNANAEYFALPKYFEDKLLEVYKKGDFRGDKHVNEDALNIQGDFPIARVLGNFKISVGGTGKDRYLSYYDKYDLNPNIPGGNLINNVGKPFEIYNRIPFPDNRVKSDRMNRQYQKGSKIEPYITSNPKDPRIQAYRDSLSLYKESINTIKNNHPDNIDYDKKSIDVFFKNDKIKPIALTISDGNPIYKKPVQEVVLKKPQSVIKRTEKKINRTPFTKLQSKDLSTITPFTLKQKTPLPHLFPTDKKLLRTEKTWMNKNTYNNKPEGFYYQDFYDDGSVEVRDHIKNIPLFAKKEQ